MSLGQIHIFTSTNPSSDTPQLPIKMAVELRNSIKEKMERGEVAYTLSVKTVRTIEISMMAKTAGFDGILIDMEHSSFDL